MMGRLTAWQDIEQAEPGFGRRVRALFDADKHKTIATLRADVSPRISGIETVFGDERQAKAWVRPFRTTLPDFQMEIVELIAKADKVAAQFRYSGAHRGEWLGFAGTGRRFESVDEIYIFTIKDGKLVSAVGVQDMPARKVLGRLSRRDPAVAPAKAPNCIALPARYWRPRTVSEAGLRPCGSYQPRIPV